MHCQQIRSWIEECSREKENEVLFQREMKSKLGVLRVCLKCHAHACSVVMMSVHTYILRKSIV